MGEGVYQTLHQQALNLYHSLSTVRGCNSQEGDSVSLHPRARSAARVSTTIDN
jgi:hypothetical protein